MDRLPLVARFAANFLLGYVVGRLLGGRRTGVRAGLAFGIAGVLRQWLRSRESARPPEGDDSEPITIEID